MAIGVNLRFYTNPAITAGQFADLLRRAGRPEATGHVELERLIVNSNLVLAAFSGNRLVGLVRALSDFASCCYVADMIVDRDYAAAGVETALMARVNREIDGGVKLVNPFSEPPVALRALA